MRFLRCSNLLAFFENVKDIGELTSHLTKRLFTFDPARFISVEFLFTVISFVRSFIRRYVPTWFNASNTYW